MERGEAVSEGGRRAFGGITKVENGMRDLKESMKGILVFSSVVGGSYSTVLVHLSF